MGAYGTNMGGMDAELKATGKYLRHFVELIPIHESVLRFSKF